MLLNKDYLEPHFSRDCLKPTVSDSRGLPTILILGFYDQSLAVSNTKSTGQIKSKTMPARVKGESVFVFFIFHEHLLEMVSNYPRLPNIKYRKF